MVKKQPCPVKACKVTSTSIASHVAKYHRLYLILSDKSKRPPALYTICKRDDAESPLRCPVRGCTSFFQENRKMHEHLCEHHNAPDGLGTTNTDELLEGVGSLEPPSFPCPAQGQAGTSSTLPETASSHPSSEPSSLLASTSDFVTTSEPALKFPFSPEGPTPTGLPFASLRDLSPRALPPPDSPDPGNTPWHGCLAPPNETPLRTRRQSASSLFSQYSSDHDHQASSSSESPKGNRFVANTPPLEFPPSREEPTPPLASRWGPLSSPGFPLPPDSPDPGRTPVHRPIGLLTAMGSGFDSDAEVQDLLTPNRLSSAPFKISSSKAPAAGNLSPLQGRSSTSSNRLSSDVQRLLQDDDDDDDEPTDHPPSSSLLPAKQPCPHCDLSSVSIDALKSHVGRFHSLYVILADKAAYPPAHYGICKRASHTSPLLCLFQGCLWSSHDNKKMNEHLAGFHNAPSSLRLQATDKPPEGLSPGPSITTTANTHPLIPPMSPEGPPPLSPLLGNLSSSPGTRQPPDSPDPGPTPSRKAYVSDDDDNPFATHSTAHRLSAPLFSKGPHFVRAESPDFDDIYEAEVPPSPRRLRGSTRRSTATSISQAGGGLGSDDNNAGVADHNMEGSVIPTDDEADDDNTEIDPCCQMLANAGLFVIPVTEHISVLACIGCKKGLKPSNALGHVTAKKPHKLKVSQKTREEVKEWIRMKGDGLANCTQDLPVDLPQNEKPIEGLKMEDGLSCTMCIHFSTTPKSHASHWSKCHRNNDLSAAEGSEFAHVQTHFLYHPRYFSVDPVLRGTSTRSALHLYVKKHSKDIAAMNSDFVMGPISPMEMPPLLQETQWQSHLRSFTGTKKKIRTLRQLAKLPRGKAAQNDPLGDTLREAIVLYMRNIRKKGLEAPLDVRGILVSGPTDGLSDPWKPLLNEKSLQDYARFLHKYAYSLLLTREGTHPSGYDFRLSNESKRLAEVLVRGLQSELDEESEHDHVGEQRRQDDDGEGGRNESADENTEGGEEGNEDGDGGGEEEDGDGDGDKGEDENEDEDEDMVEDDQEDDEDGDHDEEEDEESEEDLVVFEDENYNSGLVQKFHNFIRSVLYPQAPTNTTLHSPSKWNDPIERFIAVYSLQPDGNFRQAKQVTQVFATFHYHIRGTILYEGYSKCCEFEGNLYKAVLHEALQNYQPGSRSPYIICRDYQRLTSAIAMNANAPPTTMVSDDGKMITFRKHTLHVPTWRAGLAKLAADVEEELDDLCGADRLGLTIPPVVEDDWTDETRGYSWTTYDFERFGLQSRNPLFYKLIKDNTLAKTIRGELVLDKLAMTSLFERCDRLCEKIFLLVFNTASQPPRISEIADYKHANSTRGRNMFHHDKAVWFLNRRVKYESLVRKESSIACKASERVTKLLETYFLLIRPLEKELSYHLLKGDDQKKAYQLYSEYMWVQSGIKMSSKALSQSLHTFMKRECNVDIGPRIHRQICVEIGRIYLGSEAEIEAGEVDLLSMQMGHSVHMARSNYALEIGYLPGMSSDLLRRYGRISQAWWSVIGFKTGTPPLEPIWIRKEHAAKATADHEKVLRSLLSLVTSLEDEVKKLRNYCSVR